jgi:5-methylcytosine-specific restriction protein A
MGFTKPCNVFGCVHVKPCPVHGREINRPSHMTLYDTQRWRKTSRRNLDLYPLCGDRAWNLQITGDSRCRAAGRTVLATVTDHVRPHRGNAALFWDPKNRQSLCDECHGLKSQREGFER